MSIKLATAIRNAALTAIKDAIDSGSSTGAVKFYTTPLPSTTGAAITSQTLLASCELSKPSGTVSNGVLTFSTVSNDLAAAASGTIGFARIVDSTGAFVLDADVGVSGSSAMFIFNTLSVIAGGTVQVLSCTITEGNP
jgi:hypothetical protein